MIRTQVQFTEEQVRRLKQIALAEGVSVAELVRQCVDARLADEPSRSNLWRRADSFVGVEDDPDAPDDLSIHHDDYLEGGW